MTPTSEADPDLPPLALRLPERHRGREILDETRVPLADLSRSLAAMGAVNRRLGGLRSLLRPLRAEASGSGGRLRVLDVGTGDGGLPHALATSLRRRDLPMRWTGLDLDPDVLAVASQRRGEARPPPAFVRADGRRLPFADGSFDVVISSLTLHHVDDGAVPAFLAELARVARHRVLVSDLERHPVHYAGARFLGWTVWRRDPITRFDGPISVLRSFTPAELAALARDAGLRAVRVRRTFPFRLVLSAMPAADPVVRPTSGGEPAGRGGR